MGSRIDPRTSLWMLAHLQRDKALHEPHSSDLGAEESVRMPSSPQLPVNVASYHLELPRIDDRNRSSQDGQRLWVLA